MIKPLIIAFHSIILFLFGFLFGDGPMSVTGNFPKNVKPGSEFSAELKINKGSMSGFAKLQIEVPQGFTVKEVESKGASFTFENNIAKYIWTSAPSETEFTVKINVSVDASVSGSKNISAKYSYVNNNTKEVIEMPSTEVIVGESSEPVVTNNNQAKEEANDDSSNETKTESVTPVTTTNPTATSSTPLETPVEPNSNVSCSRSISNGSHVNEFNVEIKIKCPGIKGFAKFQDLIPEGYTAKAGSKAAGSSFSFSDGKAKFVWVSLPAEGEMVINYVLEKTTASGGEKLEGEFSYLENDQTKKVKLPTETISAESTPVAVNTPTESTETKTTEPVKTENTETNPVKNEQPAINKKEGNVSYCVQIGAFRNSISSDILTKKFNISENIRSEMAEGFHKFMVGQFNEYKGARDHREQIKQQGCASAFVAAYNGPKRITVQEALMITNQKWFK